MPFDPCPYPAFGRPKSVMTAYITKMVWRCHSRTTNDHDEVVQYFPTKCVALMVSWSAADGRYNVCSYFTGAQAKGEYDGYSSKRSREVNPGGLVEDEAVHGVTWFGAEYDSSILSCPFSSVAVECCSHRSRTCVRTRVECGHGA